MDSARTALRLGADDVYIVYRRSKKELPARIEEVHHAEEEGIQFHFLTLPVEILGNEDGWVCGMPPGKQSPRAMTRRSLSTGNPSRSPPAERSGLNWRCDAFPNGQKEREAARLFFQRGQAELCASRGQRPGTKRSASIDRQAHCSRYRQLQVLRRKQRRRADAGQRQASVLDDWSLGSRSPGSQ